LAALSSASRRTHMSGAEGSHTILLLQPTSQATSRTYQDFETLELALDGVCTLYEKELKTLNPAVRNITYDVSDLYGYLDQLTDVSCLVFREQINAYLPRGKEWIKKQGARSPTPSGDAAAPQPPLLGAAARLPPRRRHAAAAPPRTLPRSNSHAPRAPPRSVRAPQEADDVIGHSAGRRRRAPRHGLQVLQLSRV
jgi:hypothetical protein